MSYARIKLDDDPEGSWVRRAWCAGKSPTEWDSRQVFSVRQAAQLCAPCPVAEDCAIWAMAQPGLCGVVVAGVALPGDPGAVSAYEGARKALGRTYGIPYKRWCIECHREITADGVKAGARGLCNGCYRSEWDESRKAQDEQEA